MSSRELVHGGSEAVWGGDRPLRRALGTEGAFSLTGLGDEHLGKSTGAAAQSSPLSLSLSSFERFGKSESCWGERVTRHSGGCLRGVVLGELGRRGWQLGVRSPPAGVSLHRSPLALRLFGPPPTSAAPHRILFLCFLQGGALPAGVETMVLTLGESWPVLVGKRFLSLSAAEGSDGGHDNWDLESVAEWPWLSGTIRAVSHTDVTKKDLKVKIKKTKTKYQIPKQTNKTIWGLGSQMVFSYLGNGTVKPPLPPFSEMGH